MFAFKVVTFANFIGGFSSMNRRPHLTKIGDSTLATNHALLQALLLPDQFQRSVHDIEGGAGAAELAGVVFELLQAVGLAE